MEQTSVARRRDYPSYPSALLAVVRWSTAIFVLFFLTSPCFAAESRVAKNVLVLYSFTKRDAFHALEPLQSTVRSRFSAPVHFTVEYLESQHFGIDGYRQSVSEVLRHTYEGKTFDLVVAGAYPALRFAVDYRDRIFPGVPIVFLEVAASRIANQVVWPGVTGVTLVVDIRGSLDLALRLLPGTRTVALISGTSEFETYWRNSVHREFDRYGGKLNLIDLVGLQPRELLRQVTVLPPHTVVLFQAIPVDASHPVLGVFDVLAAVSQQFPTF